MYRKQLINLIHEFVVPSFQASREVSSSKLVYRQAMQWTSGFAVKQMHYLAPLAIARAVALTIA